MQSDWKENRINDLNKTKRYLEKYEFSSYLDYLNPKSNRIQSKILNPQDFPSYFTETESFERSVDDFLNYQGSTLIL
jgi:hypothetical protein